MKKRTIEKIMNRLEEVQARSSARIVYPHALYNILQENKRKKCFNIYMDGGHVPNSYKYPAETTYVHIQYDRKTKHLYYKINRGRSNHVPYGDKGTVTILYDRIDCVSSKLHNRYNKIIRNIKTREINKTIPDKYKNNFKYELVYNDKIIPVVSFLGEDYHFNPRKEIYKTDRGIKNAIRSGKKEIIDRKKRDKKRNKKYQFFIQDMAGVMVTIKDSIDSGNCEWGTNIIVEKIKKLFGNEIKEIEATELLRIENTIYTRRACEYAKERQLNK